MSTLSLRTGAPALRLRILPSTQLTSHLRPLRSVSSLTTQTLQPTRNNKKPLSTGLTSSISAPTTLKPLQLNPTPSRLYSTASSTPTADALIEELQDLYEVAKDEFEIATDSTDGATIYAASDRESARDALNELCAVYFLYAGRPGQEDTGVVSNQGVAVPGSQIAAARALWKDGPVVDPGFDPVTVAAEVKDEVRRRVGQRIRELRNAVELLEERAHAE
ncbi:uncharacterized protein N7459_003531 [Penicillium hispanicum]|uniref:uncharacterized protein n=1 Tax=Penicillium hispanicum TaxID=1080232 RepID=UPI002541F9EB|nr:uncharacterized protein N7459_003531 [Penicillium hispanicum]KAJ5587766.1 hypothetical protein N7459_003531 [Penicillium hispanicum]